MPTINLTVDQTVTGAAAGKTYIDGVHRTVHVNGQTTAGTGAATVLIEASNDGVNWLPEPVMTCTLVLSTTTTSTGGALSAPWAHVRSRVTAISGAGAAVTAIMGF